jgi:hypothetical protein
MEVIDTLGWTVICNHDGIDSETLSWNLKGCKKLLEADRELKTFPHSRHFLIPTSNQNQKYTNKHPTMSTSLFPLPEHFRSTSIPKLTKHNLSPTLPELLLPPSTQTQNKQI